MPGDNETFDSHEGADTSIQDDNNGLPADSSTDGTENNEELGDTKESQQEGPSREDAMSEALGDSEDDLEEDSPAPEDQEDEQTEEEKAKKDTVEDTRFDKHPRFQALIAKNNELEEKYKAFEPLEQFFKESTMNETDRTATFRVGEAINRALIGQSDPNQALQMLSPILEQLQTAAGLTLPDDIKKAVENGEISEKYAQDLAKQRAEADAANNRNQFETNKKQEQEKRDREIQFNQLKTQVNNATSAWEAQQRSQDPDYEQKRELVYSHIAAELQRRNNANQITTAEDAILISNKALSKVNELLQKSLPVKTPMRPNLQGNSYSSKQKAQKPTSRAEAMDLALK